MKIFGREPALYVAIIETLVAFLVTFGLDGLSAEQATNIVAVAAVIGGAITAWTTVDTRLSAVTGVGRAILILLTSYGLNLSQEQVGLAVGVIAALAMVFVRDRTSPEATVLTAP